MFTVHYARALDVQLYQSIVYFSVCFLNCPEERQELYCTVLVLLLYNKEDVTIRHILAEFSLCG